MMRTEAEIPREVEFHLGRRGLLILDWGLWLASSFDLFKYVLNRPISISNPWPSLFILFLFGWLVLLALHTVRVLRLEAQEYVARAVERQFNRLKNVDTKRKRDDSGLHVSDENEMLDLIEADRPQNSRIESA